MGSKIIKWGLRALMALAVLGVAAVGLIWLTSTKVGPLPDDAPGYAVLDIAAPHRTVPLALHLWYPAKADVPVSLIGQNALFYGFHGRISAPADGKSYPVVVLSHGSGGNAERLGWIASALSARGFVVAAVNHPGTTSQDSLPARTVMPWERASDVSAILDALQSAPPLGISPDLSRAGILGFSLGGGTAMVASGARLTKQAYIDHCTAHADQLDCGWLLKSGLDLNSIDATLYEAPMQDARLRATVTVDPALHQAMTAGSLAAIQHPVLVVNLGLPGAIPPAMWAEDMANAIPQATFHAVEGAAHFSFLATCSGFGSFVIAMAGDDNICSDSGLRERQVLHTELATLIGDFFLGELADK